MGAGRARTGAGPSRSRKQAKNGVQVELGSPMRSVLGGESAIAQN